MNKKLFFYFTALKRLFFIIGYKYFLAPFFLLLYKFKYKKLSPKNKVIYIKPEDIIGWYQLGNYKEITFDGQIIGGNWKKKTISKIEMLEKSNKYKGIVERFVDKKPWRDTSLFKERYFKKYEMGLIEKSCLTLELLENHYEEYYDNLFQNIKKNGILPPGNYGYRVTPIFINIDSDGEILFTHDGNHRLFIAMVLGIEKIPVRVKKRHSNWQKKRDIILSTPESIGLELKKHINHPDIISEKLQ